MPMYYRRRAVAALRPERASGPQVGPALLLALHDLDDAGAHITEVVQHVRLGELLCAHRVLAGDDLDARGQRLADPIADGRIGFQHADAGAVRDDLDFHVLGAEISLEVAGVVERKIPLPGVAVADLHHDSVRGCRRRLRKRDGTYRRHTQRASERAKPMPWKHEFLPIRRDDYAPPANIRVDTAPRRTRRVLRCMPAPPGTFPRRPCSSS